MQPRAIMLVSVLSAFLTLLPDSGLCQTELEATRIYEDALRLHEQARSPAQLQLVLEKYQQALAILEDLELDSKIGQTAKQLGLVCAAMGRHRDAVGYFEKWQAVARANQDREAQIEALCREGESHRAYGDYQKAYVTIRRGLELARKTNNQEAETRALCQIGMLYNELGHYSRAVILAKQALNVAKSRGDEQNSAQALYVLGKAYEGAGAQEQATSSFQQALVLLQEKRLPATHVLDPMLGRCLETQDIPTAWKLLEQATLPDWLGRFYLLRSNVDESRQFAELALLTYNLVSSPQDTSDVGKLFVRFTGLAAAHECLGQYSEAAEFGEKAISAAQALMESLTPAELWVTRDAKMGGFHWTEAFEGLARVQMKQNHSSESLKTCERLKALRFARQMRALPPLSESNYGIPQYLLRRLVRTEEQLAILAKTPRPLPGREPTNAEKDLEAELHRVKSKQTSLISQIQRSYPTFVATRYPGLLDTRLAGLRADEWAAVYQITETGVLIFLLKGGELVKGVFQPVMVRNLAEMVRRCRSSLEIQPGEPLKDNLRRFDLAAWKSLGNLLTSAILSDLPENVPLIVVPDGILSGLPFEAFVLGDGGRISDDGDVPRVLDAQFFGDRNPISYYQSLSAVSIERDSAPKKRPQESGVLIVANPEPRGTETKKHGVGGNKGDLHREAQAVLVQSLGEASGEESPVSLRTDEDITGIVQTLTQGFQGKTLLLRGKTATKKDISRQLRYRPGSFTSVIFANPAYLGYDFPGVMQPLLFMTRTAGKTDGYLRMTELMGLKLGADVVVLSDVRSRSGAPEHSDGEGGMDLARALQYAGSKSVLLAIHSGEPVSKEILTVFFEHIRDGKTKREALDLARANLRAKGYDHPYFWASFILFGEAD